MAKGKSERAGINAATTYISKGLSSTLRKAGGILSVEQMKEIHGDKDWWQFQMNAIQLAIYELENRVVDMGRQLKDYLIERKSEDHIDIMRSGIDMTKKEIESFRKWEDICIMRLRTLHNIARDKYLQKVQKQRERRQGE